MKNLLRRLAFLPVLVCIALGPSFGIAQSQEEIISTIGSGSSRELAKYFNNTLALNMNNDSGDYSSNQAELILRDFFRKFPPKDFEVVHRGESRETLWYFIGNYESEEANFKVLVKGRQENERLKIYSMDFRRE